MLRIGRKLDERHEMRKNEQLGGQENKLNEDMRYQKLHVTREMMSNPTCEVP